MSLAGFWLLIITAIFVAPLILEFLWATFVAVLALIVSAIDAIRGVRRP